jgi:hypothetical protein
MTLRPFVALLLAALVPPAARAQKRPVPVADAPPPPEYEAPREIGWAGASLVLALPTGEFKQYVNAGGGLAAFFAVKLAPDGAASIRLDGTFLIYGSETRRAPLVPLVSVDVTTSNQIFTFGLGPQLTATRGALRPYVNGAAGFSYFWTSSSVEGTNNTTPFASSTNFHDFAFMWRAGGGVWIRLGHGRTPLWLDLAAHYVRNGRVSYLRPGSIDTSFNPPVIHPIQSETNLWLVEAGVTLGLVPRRR